MSHILKVVVKHPKSVLTAILLLTIGCAVVIATRRITFNGSPEMLARDDSALHYYNEIRKTFGDDRVIVIAIITDDVFTPQFIERLDQLTNRLSALDGVSAAQSLTNLKAIKASDTGATVSKLIPRMSATRSYDASELRKLKDEITHDTLYAKQFISTDGTTAAINVFLQPLDEAR